MDDIEKVSFYDKLYFSSIIEFDDNHYKYTILKDDKYNVTKLVNSISIILERDNEIISAYLELIFDKSILYLGKKTQWMLKDKKYIESIIYNLKKISKNNNINKDTKYIVNIKNLVNEYCFPKIKKIVESIMKILDEKKISMNSEYDNLKYLINNKYDNVHIIRECKNIYENNKKIWNKYEDDLRKNIERLGMYATSINTICKYAVNKQYKKFIDKMIINYSTPEKCNIIIKDWKEILYSYKVSKNLVNDIINYYNNNFDINNKNNFCCHGELNVIKQLINKNNKNICYIGTSDLCCFMCFSYIKFLNKKGYNIIISNFCNKIENDWLLPKIEDINIYNETKIYMNNILDEIIKEKISKYNMVNYSYSESEQYDIDIF